MKNKSLIKALRIGAVVIACLLFVLYFIYFGEKVLFARFFLNADREMRTPGISEGYVPQGFDYLEDEEIFLATGYMKDKSPSRIYILDKNGKITDMAEMKKSNGKDYTGHTGGIARFGNFVYISGGDGCDVFLLSDLLDGDGTVTMVGEIKTGNDPAYCKVFDGKLYAGSFYYTEGGYDKNNQFMMTTPAGDTNTGIITVWSLDPVTGLAKSDAPDIMYSTTSKVQGMYMDGDRIYLSTSWGLTVSHLYTYTLEGDLIGDTYDFNGTKVPLVYLDSSLLTDDLRMPPMAEEIVVLDNKIYVMNESACTKYIFGNLTSGRHIYAYELDN